MKCCATKEPIKYVSKSRKKPNERMYVYRTGMCYSFFYVIKKSPNRMKSYKFYIFFRHRLHYFDVNSVNYRLLDFNVIWYSANQEIFFVFFCRNRVLEWYLWMERHLIQIPNSSFYPKNKKSVHWKSAIIHILPWFSSELNESHILSAKKYQIFDISFWNTGFRMLWSATESY